MARTRLQRGLGQQRKMSKYDPRFAFISQEQADELEDLRAEMDELRRQGYYIPSIPYRGSSDLRDPSAPINNAAYLREMIAKGVEAGINPPPEVIEAIRRRGRAPALEVEETPEEAALRQDAEEQQESDREVELLRQQQDIRYKMEELDSEEGTRIESGDRGGRAPASGSSSYYMDKIAREKFYEKMEARMKAGTSELSSHERNQQKYFIEKRLSDSISEIEAEVRSAKTRGDTNYPDTGDIMNDIKNIEEDVAFIEALVVKARTRNEANADSSDYKVGPIKVTDYSPPLPADSDKMREMLKYIGGDTSATDDILSGQRRPDPQEVDGDYVGDPETPVAIREYATPDAPFPPKESKGPVNLRKHPYKVYALLAAQIADEAMKQQTRMRASEADPGAAMFKSAYRAGDQIRPAGLPTSGKILRYFKPELAAAIEPRYGAVTKRIPRFDESQQTEEQRKEEAGKPVYGGSGGGYVTYGTPASVTRARDKSLRGLEEFLEEIRGLKLEKGRY